MRFVNRLSTTVYTFQVRFGDDGEFQRTRRGLLGSLQKHSPSYTRASYTQSRDHSQTPKGEFSIDTASWDAARDVADGADVNRGLPRDHLGRQRRERRRVQRRQVLRHDTPSKKRHAKQTSAQGQREEAPVAALASRFFRTALETLCARNYESAYTFVRGREACARGRRARACTARPASGAGFATAALRNRTLRIYWKNSCLVSRFLCRCSRRYRCHEARVMIPAPCVVHK